MFDDYQVDNGSSWNTEYWGHRDFWRLFFSDFCCVYQLKKIGLDFQPQLMICVYAMFKVLSVTQWQIPLTVILSEVSLCSVTLGGVDRGRHCSCCFPQWGFSFPSSQYYYCYTSHYLLRRGQKINSNIVFGNFNQQCCKSELVLSFSLLGE